ncbi:MAG: aminoacyl-tRNA deacylase [Bacillota bacterium]|uniref:YbaK/aminoacyl-tRNA synthetase-associated domain-containing protein n=1 Tax=Virgibacillus salarius TaxID=447199 RepID=A0A941DXF4_9BACI|nr:MULTISPECIES: YbaK/EbsC family protein [Bacillaceae]NAZ10176.1 hypothetical protein [Agaribacter marinus]MBR7797466.1 hypothetical protein [Virgibacillus salarius]MCC2249714.1 hypothetical protein [Virgibacillus sp. AGTR]MDY7042705.1 YbaK/EbsC family protein [Virgibacillus sp. M23]QRZ17157.1 hypothetical protein JUJ52_15415 [Virgibacillus sp. AGTR]
MKSGQKIKQYIDDNHLDVEYLEVNESCHSVREAANAVGGRICEFVKNICMISKEGQLIVAIVNGQDRASTSRVGKALHIDRPRLADEDEVLRQTGYPIGGVPSFGFAATFLIDPKVTELEYVYTGGGSINSLVKINVRTLIEVNKGIIARIRK